VHLVNDGPVTFLLETWAAAALCRRFRLRRRAAAS